MTLEPTPSSPRNLPRDGAVLTKPVVVLDSADSQLTGLARSLEAAGIGTAYHQIDEPETDLVDLLQGATVLVTESTHIRTELLDQLPRLRLIVRAGTGVDIIDVESARSRGVQVANVPYYCVEEVADHTVLLILSLVRQLDAYATDVSRGTWPAPLRPGVRRMSSLVVGVVGLGRIGHQVVQRLRGFGCSLLVCDPQATRAPDGTTMATLDEVIRGSDVITLHCPLTESTRGLLDSTRLGEDARRPFVINVSRGELIDLEGLEAMLDVGLLRGVGVDVLPGEPWPDLTHPVVRHRQSIVTPHVAWWSEDALAELNHSIFSTIKRFVQTGDIPSSVEVIP